MSLRRFLNLVMLNRKAGIYSLRPMDLSRQDLFYPKRPRKQKIRLEDMEAIRTPAPSVRFHPNPSPESVLHKRKMFCFGLSENKIICSEQSGRTFLYDAGLRSVVPMPSLHSSKWHPICFSVPNQEDGGGCLYIMEKVPRPQPDKGQLEAFVYTMSRMTLDKSWYHHSLPPPPYVLKPGYESNPTRSYALLGGGSHLCISATGVGTYCFDTASREWKHAGDWMLPFYGKAEYIPELNIWFGISDYGDGYVPSVSDLSPALDGEKPELCGIWKNHYPPGWDLIRNTQIVSLGSGRLCTLDFVQILDYNSLGYDGDPDVDDGFAVLTGLELLARGQGDKQAGNGNGNGGENGNGNENGGENGNGNGNGDENGNGNVKFRMISHKSMVYRAYNNNWLEAVL